MIVQIIVLYTFEFFLRVILCLKLDCCALLIWCKSCCHGCLYSVFKQSFLNEAHHSQGGIKLHIHLSWTLRAASRVCVLLSLGRRLPCSYLLSEMECLISFN